MITKLLIVALLKEIVCFCEEAHIVVCDDIIDIKINDTTSWRYVQIGSSGYRSDALNQVLQRSIFFELSKTKSLTIINRLSRLDTPFLSIGPDGILLKYLNLYNNDIIEIADYTFDRFPRLREVYLENNNIQHLGQGIFRNGNLEVVNLSRNRLRSITSVFYNSKIDCILLNHNRITYIKNEAFPTNLKQLEINDNLIETLESRVFSNLPKLQELYLENNRLTTFPNILDLKKIQYLHLAHNNLKEVNHSFVQHPDLQFIDLSSNSLKNVTIDAFSSLTTPPIVVLSFNRLTNVAIEHPEKKTDLVLYGNPWNCDCLFNLEKTLKKYNHMKSCEVRFFDKGEIPLCIENGKCGVIPIRSSDIENFHKSVRSYEDKIYKLCNFRL